MTNSVMKLFITATLFLFINCLFGQSIKVSIAVNNINVNLAASKIYNVCKGSTFNLKASNSSSTPPSGSPVYEWKNIDSSKTLNTNPINTSTIGRWVATIKYYNSGTATWTTASDTVSVLYHNQIPFNITTNTGAPIASTNMYACGSRDTTFSSSSGFSSYNWYKNNASNNVSTSNILTITPSMLTQAEGTVSFFVTAIDVNGCYVSDQKNIRRDNSVTINLGADILDCQGKPYTLSSLTTPAPGPLLSYYWSTGQTNVTSISINSAGNYSLMIINNGSKCRFYDTVKYTQNVAPKVLISKDSTICFGTSVNVSASVLSGTGPFTYVWTSNSDLSNISSNNATITPSALGLNKYSIEVSDNIGCKGYDTVNITKLALYQNPYFKVDAGSDFKLCDNVSGNLNATINTLINIPNQTYTYTWDNLIEVFSPTTATSSVTPNNTGVTEYKIIATNSLGCKSIDSIEVNVMPPITFIQNFVDSTVCVGSNIQLIGSASGGDNSNSIGYTYTWTPNTNGTANINTYDVFVNNEDLINYTLKAVDQLGCIGEVTFNVTGYRPHISIASNKDTFAFKNKVLTLIADTNVSNQIEWYDLGTNTSLGNSGSLDILFDQTIVCFVMDVNSCSNADTVTVTYLDGDPFVVFIPNVFSPKANDLKNQSLKVFALQILDEDFEFIIYDQWGGLVYKTNSFIEANTMGWNGEIKNNDLKQASNVYTYSVHGRFFDGSTFKKAGTVTLVQ